MSKAEVFAEKAQKIRKKMKFTALNVPCQKNKEN